MGLIYHFLLFRCAAILIEVTNMRNHIKGDLLREVFAFQLVINKDRAGLGE